MTMINFNYVDIIFEKKNFFSRHTKSEGVCKGEKKIDNVWEIVFTVFLRCVVFSAPLQNVAESVMELIKFYTVF